MRTLPKDFSERLIDTDAADSQRREKLREDIRNMIEQKLSRTKRLAMVCGGVLLVIFAICVAFLSGAPAARRVRYLPEFIRIIAVIGGAGCLILGVTMLWLARAGVYHRRKHGQIFLLLSILMVGGLALMFLNEGWSTGDPQLVFIGQFLLVLVGITLLLHLGEQFQLSLMQRFLELEYRIAELSEKIDRTPPTKP